MTRLMIRMVGLATFVVLMTAAAGVQAQSGNTIQRIDVREGPDGYVYVSIEDRGGAPTSVVRLEPLDSD